MKSFNPIKIDFFLRALCMASLSLAITLLSACANTQGERAYRTLQNPSKFKLVYYTPSKEYPGYKKVTIDDEVILVPTNGVVAPSPQSVYLLNHWEINEGESVLDLGTGSGVQAIFAAKQASRIVATDISKSATEAAEFNIKLRKLDHKIEVRHGDLFEPIKEDEAFDVILFNIDYPYSNETQSLWKVHERFFAEVNTYLKPKGRIYYQSGLVSNVARIYAMAEENGFRITSMRMDVAWEEDHEPIVYLIQRRIDL